MLLGMFHKLFHILETGMGHLSFSEEMFLRTKEYFSSNKSNDLEIKGQRVFLLQHPQEILMVI